MDRSNSFKLDVLAGVCSQRLDEEYPAAGSQCHRVMIDIHEPNMPTALKDLIREKGGYDVKLIIQKELFDADVNKGQSRFSMPLKQILSDEFLNENEKMILSSHGLIVGFIEPCLDETTMVLKKRNFTRTSSYVLTNNWNKIPLKNGLEEGDTVWAWFFRVQARPWIALVRSL